MFGVLSKINPSGILVGHWRTFGNAEGDRWWWDVVLFYCVPLLVAWVAVRSGFKFETSRAASSSVTVLSIFVPLAFSVLVELVSVLGKEEVRANRKLERLARHLYWNVSYGILAAMTALCALVATDFLPVAKGDWFVFSFVAVAVHFFLTALMVVKRFSVMMKESAPKK